MTLPDAVTKKKDREQAQLSHRKRVDSKESEKILFGAVSYLFLSENCIIIFHLEYNLSFV